MTILKVQAMFDSMQMQVDKKIDEMVDIWLPKVMDSRFTPEMKSNIKLHFKEELYKYMVNKYNTNIKQTYTAANWSDWNINQLISEWLHNNVVFEKELRGIIQEINKRTGDKMDKFLVGEIASRIYYEFNRL
jgi:hypothetical protein